MDTFFSDYGIHASNVEITVEPISNKNGEPELDDNGDVVTKEVRHELSLDEVKQRILDGHGIDVDKNPEAQE